MFKSDQDFNTVIYSVLLALLLINRVSSQNVHVVNATLHKSVILPCSTNRTDQAVFWLYNETIKVCDIIGGVMNLDEQNELYNNRVESFSSEFAKGNFSIKLNQLKKSDAGNYTCNFSETLTPERIQLHVTGGSGIVMRRPDSLLLFLLGYILLSN